MLFIVQKKVKNTKEKEREGGKEFVKKTYRDVTLVIALFVVVVVAEQKMPTIDYKQTDSSLMDDQELLVVVAVVAAAEMPTNNVAKMLKMFFHPCFYK